ncbi:hydrolase 1, exosortase A system-associated [Tsuneonella sp. HG222]
MTRRHITFNCAGAALVGSLDEAPGATGLLLVTGGNETRAGAFSGQAALAARIAAAGHPVFRFDRRGCGDSEGENRGFRNSAPDIAAALAAFRMASPQVSRIIGFGNCDAASALMLAGGAGLDGLVLSNPWTYDGEDDEATAPPPAAIRSRYIEKLRNPREVWRLLTGGVDLRKLAKGLRSAAAQKPTATGLAGEMAEAIAPFGGPVRFLVAERDRTGQAFLASWDKTDGRIARCSGADHAYTDQASQDWLVSQILTALA